MDTQAWLVELQHTIENDFPGRFAGPSTLDGLRNNSSTSDSMVESEQEQSLEAPSDVIMYRGLNIEQGSSDSQEAARAPEEQIPPAEGHASLATTVDGATEADPQSWGRDAPPTRRGPWMSWAQRSGAIREAFTHGSLQIHIAATVSLCAGNLLNTGISRVGDSYEEHNTQMTPDGSHQFDVNGQPSKLSNMKESEEEPVTIDGQELRYSILPPGAGVVPPGKAAPRELRIGSRRVYGRLLAFFGLGEAQRPTPPYALVGSLVNIPNTAPGDTQSAQIIILAPFQSLGRRLNLTGGGNELVAQCDLAVGMPVVGSLDSHISPSDGDTRYGYIEWTPAAESEWYIAAPKSFFTLESPYTTDLYSWCSAKERYKILLSLTPSDGTLVAFASGREID